MGFFFFLIQNINLHLHFHICLLLLLLMLLFLLILLFLFHLRDAPLLPPIQRWISTTGTSHLTLYSSISCTQCPQSSSKTSIPFELHIICLWLQPHNLRYCISSVSHVLNKSELYLVHHRLYSLLTP